MKKIILTVSILLIASFPLLAQAPPPPPGNAGTGGGPVGTSPTGAPIDGGLSILLILAAVYARKTYNNIKE